MLLLFDIDGTLLLGASGPHGLAMYEALREVHGVEDPASARIDPSGRTDGEIARLILRANDIPEEEIDARAGALRDACCAAFERVCPPDMRDTVAPGAAELLEHLDGRAGVRLSLLTGNYEPIARLKLARAGIGDHFEPAQGGFGSDDEDRAALVPVALARAGGDGTPYPAQRAAIIGDTPRDIACARAGGVHVLAVATGRYRTDELRAADGVATSASELLPLLDALSR